MQQAIGKDVDAECEGVLGVDATAVRALGQFPAAGESMWREYDAQVSVHVNSVEFGWDARLALELFGERRKRLDVLDVVRVCENRVRSGKPFQLCSTEGGGNFPLESLAEAIAAAAALGEDDATLADVLGEIASFGGSEREVLVPGEVDEREVEQVAGGKCYFLALELDCDLGLLVEVGQEHRQAGFAAFPDSTVFDLCDDELVTCRLVRVNEVECL